jgi:hypothetical protein
MYCSKVDEGTRTMFARFVLALLRYLKGEATLGVQASFGGFGGLGSSGR